MSFRLDSMIHIVRGGYVTSKLRSSAWSTSVWSRWQQTELHDFEMYAFLVLRTLFMLSFVVLITCKLLWLVKNNLVLDYLVNYLPVKSRN